MEPNEAQMEAARDQVWAKAGELLEPMMQLGEHCPATLTVVQQRFIEGLACLASGEILHRRRELDKIENPT